MQFRLRIIAISFFLGFALLLARLFYWQLIKGEELSEAARSQQELGFSVSAPRGNILTNDLSWIAARGESWLVFAELPRLKDSIDEVADKLAPLFLEEDEKEGKDALLEEANRLKTTLSREEVVWVPLKHNVSPETKEKIEELEMAGIGFEYEEKRVYPEASSAAHLLGFVGKDEQGKNKGYFGVEGYYDLILSGSPGYVSRDSDALGLPILTSDSKVLLAQSGVDLITHLDKAVQLTIEEKLKKAIEVYQASAGSVIVMDPKNGGIYGMANYPSYDPSEYYKYSDEYFLNPVVSSSFEPGSVFKIFVMAAALDAKVIEPETVCEICSGPLKVDKYYIETWDSKYYPNSTMTDVIVHSDNVGMAYVGKRLGSGMLYDYLDRFGIGELTKIDLQGEMTPHLRERDEWKEIDLVTASFGQGVAVTPIQLVKAASAIANDGVMVTPRVVDKIKVDNWVEEVKEFQKERVVSKETTDEITAMMAQAAKEGEAKWTHLRGFKVAGKTGTAQIPIAGHYDDEKTIASFIGFAPYDDPEFVMLVTLREPKSSPWASETAAPLWYSIAQDLFLYFGIQPQS
ncbi:MAG: penicillin-binding protein 2 [Candidatus Woesebacteria bacterium]|jgi:cell division protein FtsI/penicillin-binding protein 2